MYDKPRKGDLKNNYGDPKKAEKILGFKAKRSLREGMEQLINSYPSFFPLKETISSLRHILRLIEKLRTSEV